uniref:Uncharacterized protein n=1 Tax=Arion vulgaris TaxID=1028688 RepID=A0A0B6ZHJ5_9EUPU
MTCISNEKISKILRSCVKADLSFHISDYYSHKSLGSPSPACEHLETQQQL